MKDFLEAVLGIAVVIGIVALIFGICAAITDAIWNSDLPMWLKWMLLR